MKDPMRVVFYMNQFFAGIGGEEKADQPPLEMDELLGPSLAMSQIAGSNAQIVKVIVCGDSYFAENQPKALLELMEMIRDSRPDVFLASPAFGSGRNGVATASICSSVAEEMGIPAVTAMHSDNPGVGLVYPGYALPTAKRAKDMLKVLGKMWNFALKLRREEPIFSAFVEGYLPRGVRKNEMETHTAAQRVLPLLLKKIRGDPYLTEVTLPKYLTAPAPEPVEELNKATVALVTEGGLVPPNNPDNLESWFAENWYRYPIEDLEDFVEGEYKTIHAGFENASINEDPDRLLPLDALKIAEREGRIGKIFGTYLVTTGNGTATSSAKRMGREMAVYLKEEEVDAAIVTGT